MFFAEGGECIELNEYLNIHFNRLNAVFRVNKTECVCVCVCVRVLSTKLFAKLLINIWAHLHHELFSVEWIKISSIFFFVLFFSDCANSPALSDYTAYFRNSSTSLILISMA